MASKILYTSVKQLLDTAIRAKSKKIPPATLTSYRKALLTGITAAPPSGLSYTSEQAKDVLSGKRALTTQEAIWLAKELDLKARDLMDAQTDDELRLAGIEETRSVEIKAAAPIPAKPAMSRAPKATPSTVTAGALSPLVGRTRRTSVSGSL